MKEQGFKEQSQGEQGQRERMNERSWSVVVVAAGRGTRMGTTESKQYLMLAGKPILLHTLERFAAMAAVCELVLVVGAEDIARCEAWRANDERLGRKLKAIVAGGNERQQSVQRGLEATSCEWVMVHDGVRPLVTEAAVRRCCARAATHGAAVLAVPVKDTIKEVDGAGIIAATPDRSRLWAIQTPQAFQRQLLLEAHARASDEGFVGTDDAMLVERYGGVVAVAEGEYTNVKITTPEDLPYAALLLERQEANGEGQSG